MFAVIETGGKQYIVKEGDIIRVEKINGDPKKDFEFDRVLMIGDKVGNPYVKDVRVHAVLLRNAKGKKTIVFKFKRRKGYHKKKGHRQYFSEVKITEVAS